MGLQNNYTSCNGKLNDLATKGASSQSYVNVKRRVIVFSWSQNWDILKDKTSKTVDLIQYIFFNSWSPVLADFQNHLLIIRIQAVTQKR